MSVVTVSQLNSYIKKYIDLNTELSTVWVKGEISNYKKHYSGHIYFTLKDANSTIKTVIFKSVASSINIELKDGMNVLVCGRISVYEQGGTYQLYANSVIIDGIGELYKAYERLKNELYQKGLFDPKHKKSIPKYPKHIGIITSISGAAIKDILNVISRRNKMVELTIYPAKVQGIGSADSICSGIKYFEKHPCDLIILARGGGSIEDLWAFNEEKTAMNIFSCKIPIICAVGHETDFTISDFVCDMRAPTPSAGAELSVFDVNEMKNIINSYKTRLDYSIKQALGYYKDYMLNYDVQKLSLILMSSLNFKKDKLSMLTSKLNDSTKAIFKKKVENLFNISQSLANLSPLSILKRGYSYTTDIDGNKVDFSLLKENDVINVLFDKGSAQCEVRSITNGKK